jgi:hypothetical protein
VFRKVVSKVFNPWFPVDFELALIGSVTDPIESHVNSFGALLCDGAVDDATSCEIVSLEWGWRLWMSQLDKCCSEGYSGTGIEEEGSNFSLCG